VVKRVAGMLAASSEIFSPREFTRDTTLRGLFPQ
jgi:hypothetical protein